MPIKGHLRLFSLILYLVLASAGFSACSVAQKTVEVTADCSDPNTPCLLPTSTQSLDSQSDTEIPAIQQPTQVPRVDVDTAKQAYDDGTAVFVDVRSESQYEQSHIPGALNIPLAVLETRYTELDAHAWIITYCT